MQSSFIDIFPDVMRFIKVDYWKESFQLNTTSDIMVGPNDLRQFENMLVEHGIKYIVQIEDVQK